MMQKKLLASATLVVFGCFLAVAGGVRLFSRHIPCANFQEDAIMAPFGELSVAVVKTPEEQARGLSGCTKVPERSGMLFVMGERRDAAFWMKDMLIPIDIVWIADNTVIGVEEHVPFPDSGVSDTDLPVYRSPGAVDAVLEVSAGKAREYGLTRGAAVGIDTRGR